MAFSGTTNVLLMKILMSSDASNVGKIKGNITLASGHVH
jgi:hypothetical protein